MKIFLACILLLLGVYPHLARAGQFQEVTPVGRKQPIWTEVVDAPPVVKKPADNQPLVVINSTPKTATAIPILEPEVDVEFEPPRLTAGSVLPSMITPISRPEPSSQPPASSDGYNPADDVLASPPTEDQPPLPTDGPGVLQPQLVHGLTLPNRPAHMTPREYAQTMIPYRVGQLIDTKVTFYHSETGQKNSAGLAPQDQDIAHNGLPLGSRIRLHGMPGGWGVGELVVNDRMRVDKPFYRFDIWLPSHVPIPEYGAANSTVEILYLP